MSGFSPCCSPVGTGTPTSVLHTIINVGGEAEWYIVGTGPNPFELRTVFSSDGSVLVVENALTIDLTVDHPETGTKVFQVDGSNTVLTDSNSFVLLETLAGDAKVLDGEEWKINMCVLVCAPHALGSTLTNAETQWSIETAAGVFTQFDIYSTRDQIAIQQGEFSSPRHRTKKLVASMNAPRMKVEVRRTTVGTTDFFWEIPRWGGAQIEPAP